MAERRTLAEGLKPPAPSVDTDREKAFVYAQKAHPKPEPVSVAPNVAKSPISTRIRADYASALKRASLERQLSGQEPNTLQDILEQAIEPWLRSNGYVT